jgi:hypothetical protein
LFYFLPEGTLLHLFAWKSKSVLPLDTLFAFSALKARKRKVMQEHSSSGKCRVAFMCMVAFTVFSLVACGGNSPGAQQEPRLTSLTVTVPQTQLVKAGDKLTLHAQGIYSDGDVRDVSIIASWSSSNTAVATVEGNLVTAVSPGTARISAILDGVRGEVLFVVEVVPVSIAIGPTGTGIFSLAITPEQQFHAIATYPDGDTTDITSNVTWTVTPEDFLFWDDFDFSGGYAVFRRTGTATITVTDRFGITGSTEIEVIE